MHKIRLRKIWLCVKCEYIKWITDTRMIVFLVLLVFVRSFVLQPLFTIPDLTGEKLSILEPFVAVCNVPLVMLAIPLVFLVLISDFPRTDSNSVFFISRIGRLNWAFAQIALMLAQALSYMLCLFIFISAASISHCSWSLGWSKAAVNYLLENPSESGSFAANLLSGQLYRQMLLPKALLNSFFLVTLLLILIGTVQLLFNALKLKRVGFIVSSGLIAVGQALTFINASAEWIFPVAHSLTKLHYSDYFRKPIMPVFVSYLYFVGLILFMGILSVWLIRKYDYDSILEVQ